MTNQRNIMPQKTLILTNSSLPHVEESESFKKAIISLGFKAEIYIVDDGQHVTRQFGLQKIRNLINFRRIISLISIIRSGSISSILLTAPIPIFLLFLPILKYYKIKIIYTFHEPYMPERTGIYYRLTNIYHFFLIPKVNDLIFYSKNALTLYRKSKKFVVGSCHVVPLYKYREVLEEVPDLQKRKYISFIGNLGSNKDLNIFFNIAEKLPHKSFLLAGSGDLSSYEDQIKKLDNILVVNRYLTESEYFSYIDKSLYVVLPYSSASQSGVLLDVMCRGGIAVCTNIAAFSEIVTHMKTGLILDYETFCISFLKQLPNISISEQSKISNDALKLYNQNFSEEAFANVIKNLNVSW